MAAREPRIPIPASYRSPWARCLIPGFDGALFAPEWKDVPVTRGELGSQLVRALLPCFRSILQPLDPLPLVLDPLAQCFDLPWWLCARLRLRLDGSKTLHEAAL